MGSGLSLSETYDRVSDLQFEQGQRLVERLGLTKSARVLDVGCGTGRLARWMTGAVIGIDPVEERIQLARSRGGSASFEVGRAEILSAFEDASFDVVCMSSVLHWVDDKPKALAEALRVLRPGGRLGVTTPPGELSSLGTIGRLLGHKGTRGLTTTELVSLVIESGLAVTELQLVQHAHAFASGEAVVDFMEASAFGTLQFPPQVRAELAAALGAKPVVRGWTARFVATRE